MKRTRKSTRAIFICAAVAMLTLALFAGCSTPAANETADDGKLKIVTTIYPPYDFAKNVGGDNVSLKQLLPPGAESHSYEPTAKDMIGLKECDLFIYVGGVGDAWAEEVIASLGEDAPATLTLMECVDVVEEEHVEGMEPEADEHDEHAADGQSADGHDHAADSEVEYDEHVWSSPKNAKKISDAIAKKLQELDPAHADAYAKNSAAYDERLDALDAKFRDIVANAARKTLVVGDRFPFRYFVDEYGLSYYAAFPGCSSESEPSAATVIFLTNKIQEEKIPVVFYIEFSNMKVASILADETGAQALLFHSCHNVTAAERDAGVGYVELMEANAENLRVALG